MIKVKWLVGLLCLTLALPALAYIGPGAGISFIGSLFSTFIVVLLAVGAILLWPLRYTWRRMRRLAREAKDDSEMSDEELLSPVEAQLPEDPASARH